MSVRKQKALNWFFAVACVSLLVGVGWACYLRSRPQFRAMQQAFHAAEVALNERQMLELLPEEEEVRSQLAKVELARQELATKRAEVLDRERELRGERERAELEYRLARSEGTDDGSGQERLRQIDEQIRREVRNRVEGAETKLADAESKLRTLTAAFDRYARAATLQSSKWPDFFGLATPSGIEQIDLPGLPLHLGSVGEATRSNRCVSCHRGIDRSLFDRAALEQLPVGESDEYAKRMRGLSRKLRLAREMMQERSKSGEALGFAIKDLPSEVVTVPLTPGQIREFTRHPRLDLFVGPNSPHPKESFGCTVCHAGQGSALDFTAAVHTPVDSRQERNWQRTQQWQHDSTWPEPMLSKRFMEASCLKCHHQVTDLIRYGNKEEASKLLRGYNLVRENGCFGCHDIAGMKAGRAVGPDMRLEPSPALDLLPQAEQQHLQSDPANPPGTYRKVGPGLRRLVEKTNEEWTRKWLQNPRGFHPDTRMPHFYNLGTNDPTALAGTGQELFPAAEMHAIAHYLLTESKGSLTGQDSSRLAWQARQDALLNKLVPGTTLPEAERKELLALGRQLTNLALLTVPARHNVINAQAEKLRLVQESLLERTDRLLSLQASKRRLEAIDKADLTSADTDKLEAIKAELPKVEERIAGQREELTRLIKQFRADAMPVPVRERVVSWTGAVVSAEDLKPAEGERAGRGKKLFLEKGCVACHAHDATKEDKVDSQAHFGPNLTRLAAKIVPVTGGESAGRRWLIQWLLNPNVHSARTRMPITQLETTEAVDIADFLLSQKVTDWEEKDPAAPSQDTLMRLARVYLARTPGITPTELEQYLPEKALDPALIGIPPERLPSLSGDGEEQRLARGQVTGDTLKWYIGKKTISRLGCAGCHDIPGFESARVIGIPLTDWAKKDTHLLPFDEGVSYVKSHFNIVPSPTDPKDPTKLHSAWQVQDGKPPMEKIFAEALDRRTREGFLNLKLAAPRGFDGDRSRPWDEKLRMPQFHFAISHKKTDESDAAFAARQDKEEAEAREAVMTFVLGLVGEPMSPRYLPTPSADRLAEVKGRQVLEKYNCSSCHVLRPGVFEFKPSPDVVKSLDEKLQTIRLTPDYHFPNHNAWVGTPSAYPDRLMAFGTYDERKTEEDPITVNFRLVEALRFTAPDRQEHDLPAGEQLAIPEREYLSRTRQYGGMLTELLNPYIRQAYPSEAGDLDKARNKLPPPLLREGERVQPNWLYQFLQRPYPIRPSVVLRMPQFNMSPDEATTLVNYFNAVERLTNPAAGRAGSFERIQQQEPAYWLDKTKAYVKNVESLENALKLGSGLLQTSAASTTLLGAWTSTQALQQPPASLALARGAELKPVWKDMAEDQLTAARRELVLAQQDVQSAEAVVKKTPEDATALENKKAAVEKMRAVEGRIQALQTVLAREDFRAFGEDFRTRDGYATDSYRLLLRLEGQQSLCLTCHVLNGKGANSAPALDHVWDRLRPEWTTRWIANPSRMFAYSPLMQQNFRIPKPGETSPLGPFIGGPLEHVEAVRDVLLDYPNIHGMPVNRLYTPRPAK